MLAANDIPTTVGATKSGVELEVHHGIATAPGPLDVDMALLRAVAWGDPHMFSDEGTETLGLYRLRRAGMVQRSNGEWFTTDIGDELLDDDF